MYTSGTVKRPSVAGRIILGIGLLALLSFGVGWLGQIALAQGWFDTIDSMVDASRTSTNASDFLLLISQFGSNTGIIVLTLLMLVVLLIRRLFWQSAVFLGTAIAAIVCQSVLKEWVGRVRPGDLALMESGSFPSGQAFLSVVIFGLFAIYLSRSMHSTIMRTLVATVTLALVGLISYSRVALGAHYVSDVIAGNVLGFLWLIVAFWASKRPSRLVYDFS